jgi:hypothetical protein
LFRNYKKAIKLVLSKGSVDDIGTMEKTLPAFKGSFLHSASSVVAGVP